MNDPKLVIPDAKYEKSYLEAVEEDRGNISETRLAKPSDNQSFEEFVKKQAQVKPHVQFYVPSTTFWLIDDEVFIGRLSIRHELNDKLRRHGGHIGYWIRPTKRRTGYGKKILELGLIEAKKVGIANILITCDINNLPSRRIIESHGGKLQDTIDVAKDKPKLHRFWIDL